MLNHREFSRRGVSAVRLACLVSLAILAVPAAASAAGTDSAPVGSARAARTVTAIPGSARVILQPQAASVSTTGLAPVAMAQPIVPAAAVFGAASQLRLQAVPADAALDPSLLEATPIDPAEFYLVAGTPPVLTPPSQAGLSDTADSPRTRH